MGFFGLSLVLYGTGILLFRVKNPLLGILVFMLAEGSAIKGFRLIESPLIWPTLVTFLSGSAAVIVRLSRLYELMDKRTMDAHLQSMAYIFLVGSPALGILGFFICLAMGVK